MSVRATVHNSRVWGSIEVAAWGLRFHLVIRLDKLINSSESSKQSLGIEDEDLVPPKESGRKRHKLK